MYVGVDVGTQSVRASLCDEAGREHRTHTVPLTVQNPHPGHYTQSCRQIWAGVCCAVRKVAQDQHISGIGFDATCSLVLVDSAGKPLSISSDKQTDEQTDKQTDKQTDEQTDEQTCLLWMDHRAELETQEINTCGSPVLQYVGGGFSPEQQPPKLLWIKRHLPGTWARAAHFFDLPDWLTYRATSNTARSLCSVTCKWGYVLERGGWDSEFLETVGLGELNGLEKLGKSVLSPGEAVPGGLSVSAAKELGLAPNTPVAVSMIDAHAGTLTLLHHVARATSQTLCIISGTSTCIMALSAQRTFVPGVWGPYEGAVLPGLWLYEGGQTAAGSALDHIVQTHPAHGPNTTYSKLNTDLGDLTNPALHTRTRDLHVLPDLHGNRSPLALPWFRGVVSGLNLDSSYINLLNIYLATIQGLALGVRLVMEKLHEHGLEFTNIAICGGLAKNPLYLRVLASATKTTVTVPHAENMMCAGSALLAQCAAESCALREILESGQADMSVFSPDVELVEFYEKKYNVYCRMVTEQVQYRKIMHSE